MFAVGDKNHQNSLIVKPCECLTLSEVFKVMWKIHLFIYCVHNNNSAGMENGFKHKGGESFYVSCGNESVNREFHKFGIIITRL